MAHSPEIVTALYDTCAQLGIADPAWLDRLIRFESGWNPKAVNKMGSGAMGLIQFMPFIARELGFADSQDLVNQYPDTVSQLRGPVYRYFAPKAPFPTKQSLYMAVFYPAARTWPTTKEFPRTVRVKQNGQWVDVPWESLNPGIRTVQDYIDHVEGTYLPKKVLPPLLIAGAAAGLWWYANR